MQSYLSRILRIQIGNIIFLACAWITSAHAGTQYITIVNSTNAVQEQDLTYRIKTNINALLRGKHNVVFQTLDGKNSATRIRRMYHKLQNDKRTDIIIGTGIVASQQLAHLKRYRKPSIASVIIDERLQRMAPSLAGRSGIKNFTYIKSQYDVAADLHKFHQLYPFKKLGVVADAAITLEKPTVRRMFKTFTNKPFDVIYVNSKNYKQQLTNAKKEVDALYVLPLFTFNQHQLKSFFSVVKDAELPSFAMAGRPYTNAGALASLAYANNEEIRARRIALDVLKITEGQTTASLPVTLPHMNSDFVVNMQTANAIKVHPSFSVLQNADVVGKLTDDKNGRAITFADALKIALKQNLTLQKVKKDIELSQTEISEAKRAFLPSLDVNYQVHKVDPKFRQTRASGIVQTLSASATQILYSDQAIALYKARKMQVDANLEALKRTEYQVVFDVLSGFVKHFNAKRQAEIQRENTQRTRKTLEVARRKAAVGYSGKLDVYRLESELAINQANLDKAEAGYEQTQLALKKLLNLPLSSNINFVEINDPTRLLSVGSRDLFKDLNNPKKVERFTDYLLSLAMTHRPAIIQYDYNIAAKQKIADAEKRKWYLPTVSLRANAKKTVQRHDTVVGRTPPVMSPRWDISLVASLPLYDRQQKTDEMKSTIAIEKLKLEKEDLIKNINLGLRSDMQTAIASYRQMVLFRKSADSAQKNFKLVENLYKYGRSNITSLVDAQNNVLNTRLNAVNAEQQFFVDYLKVEQQSGFYYFLATPEQQNKFIKGFTQFTQDFTPETNQEVDDALAQINFINPNDVALPKNRSHGLENFTQADHDTDNVIKHTPSKGKKALRADTQPKRHNSKTDNIQPVKSKSIKDD